MVCWSDDSLGSMTFVSSRSRAARTFTADVAAKSALGVAQAKHVLNASMWNGTGMEMGFELELQTVLRYCLTSHDAPEGLDAFAAKRRPNFMGK